jgi:predicted nucleotidyltransferase
MLNQRISIPYDEIAAFCERHHIRKLSLFGSVLREDFRPEGDDPSDVDVLVEFEPGHTPGWEYYSWGNELTTIFGYPVDLLTPEELSRHFRERVLAEAVTVYERT